uniref:Uncharacterized protein n=1 Tax=Oryza nivara TaxID=4536 RepID=A0A0E0G026_ORYNI
MMRRPSAEGFAVASRWLGQWHVAEHQVLVKHVVTQQDPSPEIHPADGAAERDDLGGAVEDHLAGRVRDGEHPVPLDRLTDGHSCGFPAADVGVEAHNLELHGAPDGWHEAGDDVAGAAGAADDGDLLVAEGGDARVRQQPEGGGARAWAGRVDEVVVGFDSAVEPVVGWKTTWLAVSGMGSTLSLSTGSLMDTAVDFQRPTSESKRRILNSMGRLMVGMRQAMT